MKNVIPSYVRVPVIFALVFAGMEYFIDSGDKPAFIEYPMVSLFLALVLFVLIAIEIMLSAVDNVMFHLLSEEEKKARREYVPVAFNETKFYKNLMKRLTKSRSIEEEGELLLEHDYDGIKELDNSLPPWWLYGFYISIAFAAIYLIRFEILDGDNQTVEYEKEVAMAKVAIEEYKKTAKDLIDVNSVTLLTESGDLEKGKEVFNTNCVACHRNDGGGGIGPNLTDAHWILGGGIKNVFHTIMEGGRDGKGMVSWKGILKPSEIQQVASYILSLQGTNPPDAKEAQGDVWVDEAANTDKKEENAVVQKDSTAVTSN
ncbi:cbb3-type cytochrome c oxidase N-terminal domain-containing protein [Flavobacterium sp. '19STA2R22 D10 B1']|uniref:cbb3-type cytochrome c oxidase N-terminal domain-containing protein n=1 Tax=Flavobacterium aerium TaxID=3037261 RepID=UPI00278C6A65|nr:cbb3-type cytochrome c oxidase N-terminal domain-containing protein [Flavobacterium sp. '19STA2R22 D10 B1']